jgi:hypothetical protein
MLISPSDVSVELRDGSACGRTSTATECRAFVCGSQGFSAKSIDIEQ